MRGRISAGKGEVFWGKKGAPEDRLRLQQVWEGIGGGGGCRWRWWRGPRGEAGRGEEGHVEAGIGVGELWKGRVVGWGGPVDVL